MNAVEECVVRPDGTLLCFDRDNRKYYRLSKQEVSFEELTKADLDDLVNLFCKPRDKGKGEE